MRKIELLAPAHDLEAGLAAVECGADAVYIGGPAWGARSAAGNSVDDIARLVERAHLFGARVYATMNTLLFDDELAEAQRIAQSLLDVGVDALIVQDMAFLRMGLRARDGALRQSRDGGAPEFHASTQTAAMTPERVRFLAAAGFSRVILERALSLDEIRNISATVSAPPARSYGAKYDTNRRRSEVQMAPCGGSEGEPGAASGPLSPQIEVFIHGAICVGFSGRCYLSRAMTGGRRSGNRGTCSQPCRLPWDLTDAEGQVIARGKHLLSVRDLDLSARLGQLLDAGATSLKIEGRLKDANYVRNIVSHYNSALNAAIAERNPASGAFSRQAAGLARASAGFSVPDFVPNPVKSFSRGSGEWFFDGWRTEKGVSTPLTALTTSPKSIGERLGRVEKVACDRTGGWWIKLDKSHTESNLRSEWPSGKARDRATSEPGAASGPLSPQIAPGDGLCFLVDGEMRGTNVNRVIDGRIYIDNNQGVTAGMEIFRNYDHAFARALSGSRTKRRIAVAACVETSPKSIAITFTDESGIAVTVSRNGDFEPARDPTKMLSVLRDELARSGDTIFTVVQKRAKSDTNQLQAALCGCAKGEEGVSDEKSEENSLTYFIPISVIAALRREGLDALLTERQKLVPERRPAVENRAAKFPCEHLDPAENVTNRLAEQFYRDHGATSTDSQTELAADLTGATVMRSRYCLRRELGMCGEPAGQLFLVHGTVRLRVETDCKNCQMTLVML